MSDEETPVTAETKIVRVSRELVSIILGVASFATGLAGLVFELRDGEMHKLHIYIAAGLVAFGAFLTVPSTVIKIIVTVIPYIPLIGGKRAGDPPAQKKLDEGP